MKDCILNRKIKYVYWDVCPWIVAVNAVVFMLTNVLSIRIKGIPLVYCLSLVPNLVNHGFVWQFFTYMFVHSSATHLLLNMYGLFLFGKLFERSFGSIEFIVFYFTTGFLGGVVSYIVYKLTGLGAIAIMGASGAIYALLFIQSVMYPRMRLVLFFFIPVKMSWAMIIFIIVEIISQLTGSGASVAHLVHLSSIGIAWVYSCLRFRISPWKVWKDNL